jgi:hypothetical protein
MKTRCYSSQTKSSYGEELIAKQHMRIHDVTVRNASHEEQPAQSEGLIHS